MRTTELDGTWQLLETPLTGSGEPCPAASEWAAAIEAVVPGEVHLDLLRHGKIQEPLYDRNAPDCAWVEDRAWWFRRNFTHNGDHGRTGKNWVLWDEISHIPLMVWHPEMGHGARPKQFVQPIDYFPTICEVGSVETPDGLHGRSLLPYLDDPDGDDPRDAILFGEFRNTCNITDGEYTLFQGVDPSHPPLYSYTNILSKWNSGDWGPFDGVRRRVGPKNSNNSGGKNETRFYHNATDPKQENNIRDSAPEQLLRMRKLMSEKLQAIDAPTELLARFGLDKI